MIWAVVLAAGESRRMGTQKLLLPFGDTTVVAAVVRTAQASRVGRTLVVLGADRDAVRLELEPRGVEFAVNEDYPLGMLSSVQAGFRALPADAEAAVVMLGDQPFLPSRVVDTVIGAYEEGGQGIVIPAFQGRRGHPVLIDLKYRDEVLALDPGRRPPPADAGPPRRYPRGRGRRRQHPPRPGHPRGLRRPPQAESNLIL